MTLNKFFSQILPVSKELLFFEALKRTVQPAKMHELALKPIVQKLVSLTLG